MAWSRPSARFLLHALLVVAGCGATLRRPSAPPAGSDEQQRHRAVPPNFFRRRGPPRDDASPGAAQLADRIVRGASTAIPAVLTSPRKLWQECQSVSEPLAPDSAAVDSAPTVEPPPAEADPAPVEAEPPAGIGRRQRRRKRFASVQYEGTMEDPAPRVNQERKKRILMLISDTGGGHRASAQAMESMIEQVAPGTADVRIVDVYTDYCPWPYSTFVNGYAAMAKNPWIWKTSWYASCFRPYLYFLNACTAARCTGGFRKCFEEHDPDLVVSVHPLTQDIPLKLLQQKGKGKRTVPFATVVTDLGSAHPFWFDRRADACFVPSDAVRRVAKRRGLKGEQIRQYGLPVRPSFWQTPRSRAQLVQELGLEGDRKTVLIVGGGDGVGSLGKIVEATASALSKECPDGAQVVAVCGKNAALREQLESKQFGNVHVQVCGFVKQMSDYMEIADVMVTKAGPGTIAEATIRGLPTMLSSFLPGQEAGNVPFVIRSGFGEYAKDPNRIAAKVAEWIQDPEKLETMASAARNAAAPAATQEIAVDLLALLEDPA